MSTQPSSSAPVIDQPTPRRRIPRPLEFFRNLRIGTKLTVGFGVLVALTLISAGVSYLGSNQATNKIDQTGDVRVPAALAASRAQADLLRMLSDVRAYLALGATSDVDYKASYAQSAQAFLKDLDELDQLAPDLDPQNQQRLLDLRAAYAQWSQLPSPLFELHDDQLDREPAYRLLATDGTTFAGKALIKVNEMITTFPVNQANAGDPAVLQDMARFQGTLASMFSALRGYVTTRNRIYRGEYAVNLTDNQVVWDRLNSRRSTLTPSQQKLLDDIATNRTAFLQLPDQLFSAVEGPHWREDLYQFSSQAVPIAEMMQKLLNNLVADQQSLLTSDLDAGRQDLNRANQLIVAGGVVALVLGIGLAAISRSSVAGPIRRLTEVAERIRTGDLGAQAQVEFKDETGTLAETFNNMTGQLRGTIVQVRREKKRADDLLEVVIPIGVDLASEKDFNRLVERITLEAKTFCHADAGLLFTMTDDSQLKLAIWRNDTLNKAEGGTTGQDVTFPSMPVYDAEGRPVDDARAQVVLSGKTLNIPDVYAEGVTGCAGFKEFDQANAYRHVSALILPVKNSNDAIVGVLELLNAKEPETGQIAPFDPNLQQMMESLSALAGVALESYIRERALRREIQQLRIEVDEAKRQKQVSEIVDTDFFQNVQVRARAMRQRRQASDSTPGEGDAAS